jgi:hypothetical protein
MWLKVLRRRWFGRTRPFPSHLRRRRASGRRADIGPRLEVLEDRTLLSAPPVALLGGTGNLSVPATSQGGQVSGTYFLGGSFNTGNQSIGGIASTSVGQFGAQLNLNLSGKVGLDLGYSASAGGQVNSTYSGVSLQQNYTEPTQFNQEVNFTPQNTKVSYGTGNFSTTGPSLSASAALDANIGGSVGGTFAFFQSYSGSTNFSTNIDQPLFSIGIGSTGSSNGNDVGLTDLSFLGQNFADQLNQAIQDLNLSATVTPLGPEIPLIVTGNLSGSTNPLGLHETLSAGVGEGEGDEAIGGTVQLGSMDQYIPDIALNSNSLQNGGVLTDTEQGNLADLNIQMGSLIAGGLLDTTTFSIGPASVIFTPVSFQMGPDLTLVQTSTITPTSQLTYNFSSPVVVTLDGQVQNGGNPETSVTFTPGVDTLGVQFTGNPVTVTPTWTFTENYTEELDLDVNLQGTLTAGEVSAAFGPVSSPPLGPAYQQTFNLANFKIATIYDNTTQLATETESLPSFTIGSSFTPSLNVTQFTDSDAPGSLRGAVLSANLADTSSPQIIHLGPGTYNLTIASNASGQGSSGGLYVTAPNLIIEGAGLGQTIINASGLGGRAFDVASGANLTLEGVTVTGGSAGQNQDAGAILNSGTVTIDNSSISGNSALVGGAIENDGTLTIDDSTISDNTSNEAGGAIANDVGATLTISDSTVSGNAAGGFGGGISNGGTLTIDDSTIAGNKAAYLGGGGVFNSEFGTATISDSTVSGNAAIAQVGLPIGGGGVFNSNVLSLINSTLSNNNVSGNGLTAGNGGGLATSSQAFRPNMVTTLDNTIVAGNFENSIVPSDIYGVINGTSYNNLIGDSNGETGISNDSNGNLVGQQNALIDPDLAPLGNYGGPTQTIELLPGSPAIDAGTSDVPGGLPLTDQRGFARDINGKVDIGAVEYQYDLGLSGTVAPGSTPTTVQYVYIVTNNGPDPVTGATLTVPLAQGTTFQSLTSATGWTESDPGAGNNGTVTFTDTGSLNSGQSAELVIAAQLQNTTAGTALSTTATGSPANWDNDLQNNSVHLTVINEQEGQTFNKALLFRFTDPNPNAMANDFTATVNWDGTDSNSSNDGSGTVSVVADPNGGFDVLGSHAYTEEGNYGIAVTVTGLDGTTYSAGRVVGAVQLFGGPTIFSVISEQQLFIVADAPLTAGALTPPPNATINQAITNAVLFHFTDADPNGTTSDYTATVNWGDGSANSSSDGSGTVSVVADVNGGFDVIGSHTYTQIVNPGTLSVQVSDAGGASTSASDSNFQVLALDQPLTAGALNVPSVTTEGQSISNQVLFHFTDADPDAQASDYLATVAWGDGTANRSNDGTGTVSVVADANGGFDVVGSHTFQASSGNYFSVKVTDLGDPRSATPDAGRQFTGATSSTPLTIIDPPVVVTAGPTFTDLENTLSAVQTVATFTDPGGPETTGPNPALTPYIATIQWGDGTATVASLTAQANYGNASVNSQGQITGQIISVQEAGGIVLGSDGQTFSVNLAHQYANYGNYTITILLNHEGVLSPTVTIGALVASNDKLTATGAMSITSTFGAGISNATVATFTDTNTTNPASEFTATINWGDGQSSAGTIAGSNGSFTVTGSHDYATVGNFPIGVTISNFGGTATATAGTSALINPATPALTVSDAGGTYNGQPFTASATAVGVDGKTPVAGSFSFAYYAGTSATGTPLSNVPVNAGTYTVVATFTSSDPDYSSGGTAQATFTISPAEPTLSVTDAGGTYSGNPFPASATALGVDGKTPVNGSFAFAYYAGTSASGTPLSGPPANAGIYTVVATFTSNDPNYTGGGTAQTTFTISQATLTAAGTTVAAIAGAPFSGLVATFNSTIPMSTPADFTATVRWGDGSMSSGVIGTSGSAFTVSGSHTYAAAGSYTIQVTISQVLGNMTSATVSDPAAITNLGKCVQRNQTQSADFWSDRRGQALINSFNGGPNSTALSSWLATTFPSLFGAEAGANNLTGKTNAQVAAFMEGLVPHDHATLEADVLATALNIYATTLSLGGTAGEAYGFDVSADGLGADSFNVCFAGAAFGVRDFTTLNVYQLLLAVNNQAVNGVLYNGNGILQLQADLTLDLLNQLWDW